jgi:flagellar hook assembly protein FlgD
MNLRNFPNPVSVSTTFSFEHNQPNTELDVSILIYNEAGALVKRIKKVLNTAGTRKLPGNLERG